MHQSLVSSTDEQFEELQEISFGALLKHQLCLQSAISKLICTNKCKNLECGSKSILRKNTEVVKSSESINWMKICNTIFKHHSNRCCPLKDRPVTNSDLAKVEAK